MLTNRLSNLAKLKFSRGKVKVEVKFLAEGGWAYTCNAASEDYIRTLKRGERVSIRPDDKFVYLEAKGKNLRLKIIDVTRILAITK